MTAEFRADLLNGVTVVKGRAVGLALDEKGAVQEDRAAVHGDSLRDVGEPRAAARWRCGWRAPTRPRSRRRIRRVATTATLTNSQSTQEHQQHHRRRGSARVERLDVVLRLVAAQRLRRHAGAAMQPTASGSRWRSRSRPRSPRPQIYWFDDTGRGGVRVPKSWRLLYKDGNDWKPVEAAGEFGVAKDAYNTVRVQAGHDLGAAHRAGHAAQRLGRRPGVEGQVIGSVAGGPGASTRARRRPG